MVARHRPRVEARCAQRRAECSTSCACDWGSGAGRRRTARRAIAPTEGAGAATRMGRLRTPWPSSLSGALGQTVSVLDTQVSTMCVKPCLRSHSGSGPLCSRICRREGLAAPVKADRGQCGRRVGGVQPSRLRRPRCALVQLAAVLTVSRRSHRYPSPGRWAGVAKRRAASWALRCASLELEVRAREKRLAVEHTLGRLGKVDGLPRRRFPPTHSVGAKMCVAPSRRRRNPKR